MSRPKYRHNLINSLRTGLQMSAPASDQTGIGRSVMALYRSACRSIPPLHTALGVLCQGAGESIPPLRTALGVLCQGAGESIPPLRTALGVLCQGAGESILPLHTALGVLCQGAGESRFLLRTSVGAMPCIAHDSRLPLSLIVSVSLLALQAGYQPAYARKADSNSPLPIEQEVQVKKANKLAKSGRSAKAITKYQTALNSATNVAQCLAIAENTEKFGAPLMDVRRACVQKALTLAKSREDLFQVALKARQYQYFEITKSAIDSLIVSASTNEELFALAQKSQEIALVDVAHMAMEKIYRSTKTVPDALNFIARAKLLNMEDLERKAIKDLIEDEPTSQGLCNLLTSIEPFQMTDLERYLLRRAVYAVKTLPDCKAVFEASKRFGQADIANLAAYRGRKMILQQQMLEKAERDAQEAQNDAQSGQEQKAADDLAKQHGNYADGPGF